MDEQDREYFEWVCAFNAYDPYSKSVEPPDVAEPYYEDLVAEFFPDKLAF